MPLHTWQHSYLVVYVPVLCFLSEFVGSKNIYFYNNNQYYLSLIVIMIVHTLIWKNDVLAILVTGDRTCCLAWITFTRNASTAFRPMSSRYTREINTSPLWLYTNRPPIILLRSICTNIQVPPWSRQNSSSTSSKYFNNISKIYALRL